MKGIHEGPRSQEGGNPKIEEIIGQPIVEEQIALHVRNLREIFVAPDLRNAEVDSKIGRVLEGYARLIANKFEEIRDIERIDTSDPKLGETISSKTFPIAKRHLEALMDGKFLGERLADEIGNGIQDWLDEKAEAVLAMVAVNIMHDTLFAAYCLRLGVNPERLRISSQT
jgi:hypothetical protein